jgi:hypothetical protein
VEGAAVTVGNSEGAAVGEKVDSGCSGLNTAVKGRLVAVTGKVEATAGGRRDRVVLGRSVRI